METEKEQQKKPRWTEETRKKISETLKEKYRLGLKDKHNAGTFKKGRILPADIEKKRDENAKLANTGSAHYAWKGGTHATAKRIVIRAGIDMTQCRICKDSLINKQAVVHHCDGNEYNNNLFNLAVLCYFCHNAIHDTPNKRANRFQVGHNVPQEWRDKRKETIFQNQLEQ
jgi:hypothetical protein